MKFGDKNDIFRARNGEIDQGTKDCDLCDDNANTFEDCDECEGNGELPCHLCVDCQYPCSICDGTGSVAVKCLHKSQE